MYSEEENLLGPGRVGGLGLLTAIVFLSGEMAGSGVLALPKALVGTGSTQSLHKGKMDLWSILKRLYDSKLRL